MTNRANGQAWASEEFGLAELGDERRVKRLVKVAAEAMNQPAGKVTAVFEGAAEREGTFRLLENEAIAPEAIARAAHRAAARRGAKEPYVFVAVDGSSLNLVDHKRAKGLGVVGARFVGATGLQVMSALAISPKGVPLGLCGQKYWARTKPSTRTGKNDRRPGGEGGAGVWVRRNATGRGGSGEKGPETKPWFQPRRGGRPRPGPPE